LKDLQLFPELINLQLTSKARELCQAVDRFKQGETDPTALPEWTVTSQLTEQLDIDGVELPSDDDLVLGAASDDFVNTVEITREKLLEIFSKARAKRLSTEKGEKEKPKSLERIKNKFWDAYQTLKDTKDYDTYDWIKRKKDRMLDEISYYKRQLRRKELPEAEIQRKLQQREEEMFTELSDRLRQDKHHRSQR